MSAADVAAWLDSEGRRIAAEIGASPGTVVLGYTPDSGWGIVVAVKRVKGRGTNWQRASADGETLEETEAALRESLQRWRGQGYVVQP